MKLCSSEGKCGNSDLKQELLIELSTGMKNTKMEDTVKGIIKDLNQDYTFKSSIKYINERNCLNVYLTKGRNPKSKIYANNKCGENFTEEQIREIKNVMNSNLR